MRYSMNKYVAMYKGKTIEVVSDTSYHAQQKAALAFKAKKEWEVSVYLNGKVDTASLGGIL